MRKSWYAGVGREEAMEQEVGRDRTGGASGSAYVGSPQKRFGFQSRSSLAFKPSL
jgi:hypothetical protein